MEHRPYQSESIDAVFKDWETHKSVMIVAATGAGKSSIMLSITDRLIQQWPGARVAILAHRQELISQPKERVAEFFPHLVKKVGIMMGQKHDDAHRQIIIGTVQTLGNKNGRRIKEMLRYGQIALLVVDECFVAGTLVDGRRIETLLPGDVVTAWDEKLRGFVKSKVVHLFKNKAPSSLVRITAGGKDIVCTLNHPILCNGQWINAGDIKVGDRLVQRWEINHDSTKTVRANLSLCGMREGSGMQSKQLRSILCEKNRHRLLFKGMRKEASLSYPLGYNGENKQEVCQRENEEEESYGKPSIKRKSESEAEEDRILRCPWWQWKGNAVPGFTSASTEMEDGSANQNWSLSGWQRLSNILQGRHRKRSVKNCYRNRWQGTQATRSKSVGSEKDEAPRIIRVDSVEVLERTGNERFGRVCPDGFVYNIEVEKQHTYTANGLVVHNCHHFTKDGAYNNVLTALRERNPDLKVLGVTATPERADKKDLTAIFEKESANVGVRKLIDEGWLCNPNFIGVTTPIDLSDVKVQGSGENRDYNKEQLVAAVETDDVFKIVVDTHVNKCGDKPTVAFLPSVKGAYKLAELLRDKGFKAIGLDGNTPKDERENIIKGFKSGVYTCICNCAVLTEGFDAPHIECIHIVRPTKSDSLYLQIVGRALRIHPGKEGAFIYDYQPKETRNFDQRLKKLGLRPPSLEPKEGGGERQAKKKHKAKGEIQYTVLDYFKNSRDAWAEGKDGWKVISFGRGADNVDRGMAVPPDGTQLWVVWRRENDSYSSAKLYLEGTFEEIKAKTEEYIRQYGNRNLSHSNAKWRMGVPTQKAEALGRNLRIFKEGMTAGELSDLISARLTLQAVGRERSRMAKEAEEAARRAAVAELQPELELEFA